RTESIGELAHCAWEVRRATSPEDRTRPFQFVDFSLTPRYVRLLITLGGVVADLKPVSDLLASWQVGDQNALETLVPLVYNELRLLAHRYLRKQRPGHTLQSTALVHEAYLRLAKQKNVHLENRNQFFALAALIMRQILVDYARNRQAAKRDGGCKVTLDDSL